MIALMLTAWMAYAGDCKCEKLPEKLAACCRALGNPSAAQQMDWVEYYRTMGNQIPSGRINYAPVFVSPTLQWAVPNSCLNGPPASPPPDYGPPPGYSGMPGYPHPNY